MVEKVGGTGHGGEGWWDWGRWLVGLGEKGRTEVACAAVPDPGTTVNNSKGLLILKQGPSSLSCGHSGLQLSSYFQNSLILFVRNNCNFVMIALLCP